MPSLPSSGTTTGTPSGHSASHTPCIGQRVAPGTPTGQLVAPGTPMGQLVRANTPTGQLGGPSTQTGNLVRSRTLTDLWRMSPDPVADAFRDCLAQTLSPMEVQKALESHV